MAWIPVSRALLGACLLCCAGFWQAAQADTLSYASTLFGNGAINIPQFDGTLGQLNSVTLSLSTTTTFGYTARTSGVPTGPVDYSGDLNYGFDFVVFTPSNLTLSYHATSSFGGTINACSCGSDETFGSLNVTTPAASLTTVDVAPWMAGISPLGNKLIQSSQVLYTSNVSLFIDELQKGTLTVSYDYSPNSVPLPASSWLLLSGLLGMGLLARRRALRRDAFAAM